MHSVALHTCVTSTLIDQLSDLFDQLVLLDCRFVIVGDLNVPGVRDRWLDNWTVVLLTCSCSMDSDSTSAFQLTSAATSWT